MSDLDDLEAKYGVDELAELEARYPKPQAPRQQFGPYADNPSFSAAPPERALPMPPGGWKPEPKPESTRGGALAMGITSGAMAGFDDEAVGLLDTIVKRYGLGSNNPEFGGVPEAEVPPPNTEGKTFGQQYRDTRDKMREEKAQGAKDYPLTTLGGQIGGMMMQPGGGKGAGATALGRIGQAAVQGGAYAAGESEADLTKGEVAPLLKDTGKGAAVGAAVGTVAEGAKGLVKGAAKFFAGDLKRKILNEVAEGTANVGQAERKRLQMAGDAIVKEVTTGPDAKVVREAYLGGSAVKGVENLGKIINEVADRNAGHYDAFEKAGRGTVDMTAYMMRLEQARRAALEAGDARLAKGLEPVAKTILDTAKETGGMTLERLRALTTQAQETAANALGSLLERQNAKVARRVQGVVTEAMDDTLSEAAKGVPALEQAASSIRENNGRLHALLTIDDALQVRARKESSLPGPLVRGVKAVTRAAGLPVTGAVIGGMSGGDDDRAQRAVIGGALGLGALPAARAIERGITTMGIKATQNPNAVSSASKLAGAMARIGGGAVISKRKRDEEEAR